MTMTHLGSLMFTSTTKEKTMSDEYYFEGDDDKQFFSQEEEQHFYAVLSDYIELMTIYDSNFILLTVCELMKEKQANSLNSLN
jgi:hypothetical protein